MKKPPEEWKTHKERPPLGNYGLTIVLGAMFVVSWAGQFVFQYFQVRDEAQSHGEAFAWSQFWPEFWSATLENWQSEFLQLLTFVVLTTYLIHRGSAESRDSDDELRDALERIEQRLDREVDLRAGATAEGNGRSRAR